MSKRSRDTDDIPSRNVKAKHNSLSTASTKEGDLRDATEFKRQDSMDSTQSQYPDKETVTLSRSASDSLTVYKRGLEKMDLDQCTKNIDALEVEVAKQIIVEAKLAEDYAAQVKKNRKIVKVKKALKQELKAVKDENEEVKGSLYTLTLRSNELKEQLEKAQKESRYWYDSYGEAYDDYTREWDCADKAREQLEKAKKEAKEYESLYNEAFETYEFNLGKAREFELKLENSKKMERKQQHLIKRLEKDLHEESHLVDFQAFISKGEMEALRQENKKLKEEKEDAAMEIASQQMDIENFHAVATEARAEVEKLKQELVITKVEVEEYKLEAMRSGDERMQLETEAEFATTAKDSLLKQLQKTEAQLIQALGEVTEAQEERNKLRGVITDSAVAPFINPTASTIVPGAFIRLKGTNAEGKRELWFGQIGKVNPANLSVTVDRYWEEAETKGGAFLMVPCKASAGLPLKGEWLDVNAFQVLNHFPTDDVSYNHSMKKACERAGWGPFDNCDQHTAEQHAAMQH